MHFSYERRRVGRRIQALRMAQKFTQEQLAERLDCSLRFVADIERGAVGMSINTLVRVCPTLRTSPNALLADEEENAPVSAQDWVLHALESLTPRQRETALEILRAYLRGL